MVDQPNESNLEDVFSDPTPDREAVLASRRAGMTHTGLPDFSPLFEISLGPAERCSLRVNHPVVEMKKVSKAYGGTPVVVDFNLTIEDETEGEFVAVLGPSGCGKSTVLKILAGQVAPDSGEARTMGQTIVLPDNPHTVTVQQAYTCFDWRTVLGNVTFGLELAGMARQQAEEVARMRIKQVGLEGREEAHPSELSGGMKQRVALARTLAVDPRIMLMDEPFGALDAGIRSDMQKLLVDVWQRQKNTVLFITHDVTEALLLADRVIVLSPRPARIVKDFKVPFGRPRPDTLSVQPEFTNACQMIIELLKANPSVDGGQVRITI